MRGRRHTICRRARGIVTPGARGGTGVMLTRDGPNVTILASVVPSRLAALFAALRSGVADILAHWPVAREIQPALVRCDVHHDPVTVTGVIALAMTLRDHRVCVVDGVLFKPLPYPSPSELYGIEGWFSWAARGTSWLQRDFPP